MGTLVGYGASEFVDWDVELDPSVFGTDITYSIQITYNDPAHPDDQDTVFNEFTIEVPPGPYDINVSSDDSSFCAGETTGVYVDFPDMGSSFYAVHWFPPEPVLDPFSRNTMIFPETTSVIHCIVEDDLGCVHTDSVVITILQPPTEAIPILPTDGSIANPIGNNNLVWNASEGSGPITYSVYYDDGSGEVELVSGISDTTYPLDALCSTIYDWYVIAENPCGSTPGPHSSFETIPCGNPVAHPTFPEEGVWSACADQFIAVFIEDSFDIDPTSFAIEVNDIDYSWPDDNLAASAEGDTLYFVPTSDVFTHGERVEYTVTEARNIYGVNTEPASSYFFVDLEPPTVSDQNPADGQMVLNTSPQISFDVEDADLSVDETSIVLTIDGYGSFELTDGGTNWNAPRFTFNTEDQNITFPAGDTVYISVDAADLPDLCSGNIGTTEWSIVIQPTTVCRATPNPFTPNGDGTNDQVVFGFPFMFSDGAKLQVFSKRQELVYEADLSDIERFEDYAERSWDGMDKNGQKLPPGLYLYIITQKGEVVCNGSITLVR